MREFNLTAVTIEDFQKECRLISATELPEWSIGHPSDVGTHILWLYLKALARGLSHMSNWSRGFSLMTATTLRDVLSRARSIGYRPRLFSSSVAEIYVVPESGTAEIADKYSIVLRKPGDDVSEDVYFTNQYQIQTNGAGTLGHQFVSGKPFTDNFTGTGEAFQSFVISGKDLIEGSIEVYVNDVRFENIDSLVSASVDSQQCVLGPWPSDDFRAVYVQFGNGVKGYSPPAGAAIKVIGRAGGGIGDNIQAAAEFDIIESPFSISLAYSTAAAQGGKDAESIEQIKLYAPYAYALRSVLGKEDQVVAFTEQLPYVSRAAATVMNKLVMVSVVPAAGTEFSGGLADSIAKAIKARLPMGFWAVVQNATYLYPTIDVEVTTKTGYVTSAIINSMTTAIQGILDPEAKTTDEYGRLKWKREFGQDFFIEELRTLFSSLVYIERDWVINQPTSDLVVAPTQIVGYANASITVTSRNTVTSGVGV